MGAGQSTAASGGSSSSSKRGLHVLRVTPGSPAATETDIEPFFDFIIGIEGASDNAIDASQLESIVESHEGRTLSLRVYNSQRQSERIVQLVPSPNWSQDQAQGPKEPDDEARPSLLGLSMRLCDRESALENVWHVMDVFEE
jgi:hypothetical protein